jgi:hypothetical protein
MRLRGEKAFDFISHKKNPAKRPGNKGGTGLGMPVPMARNGEGTGLRRATAYSQKSIPVINRVPDTN